MHRWLWPPLFRLCFTMWRFSFRLISWPHATVFTAYRQELPRLVPVLKRSLSFVGPLAVLVVWMFFLNRRPEEAGLLAAAAALVIGILTPGVRLGWQEILRIFLNAGRGMLEIAAITGLAGVVIGVLQLTGLGFTLTLTLLNIGQSNALLLLVLTAIVSMVLGMGMPTTAVYVLLAVWWPPVCPNWGFYPLPPTCSSFTLKC